jgi:hypothetical protein
VTRTAAPALELRDGWRLARGDGIGLIRRNGFIAGEVVPDSVAPRTRQADTSEERDAFPAVRLGHQSIFIITLAGGSAAAGRLMW